MRCCHCWLGGFVLFDDNGGEAKVANGSAITANGTGNNKLTVNGYTKSKSKPMLSANGATTAFSSSSIPTPSFTTTQRGACVGVAGWGY
jgi:hypothetical protein